MKPGQNRIFEVGNGYDKNFPADDKGDIIVMRKMPYEPTRLVDFYAFIFCNKGTMNITINDASYMVQSHSLVFLGQYSFIDKVTTSIDFDGIAICFSQSILTRFFLKNKEMWGKLRMLQSNPVLVIPDECIDIHQHMYGIFSWLMDMDDERPYYDHIVEGFFRGMLFCLLSKLPPSHAKSGVFKQRETLIVRFITLVKQDEARHRNLDYYANLLFVTTKYLSTICKRTLGKTAHRIIEEETVTMIKHYLFNTDMSIKQIAVEMNFCSLSFFGKFVRQHFGKSPSQLREEME